MSDIWMRHESFVTESWVTYSLLRGCVSCSLAQFGTYEWVMSYRVATISRLLKIVGLFCRISSLSQGSFAKETCNLKLFHRALLQKRPVIWRSLLHVATPYKSCHTWYIWMRQWFLWMSHGSWVIFEWDTNHLWRSHGSCRVCCEVRLLSLAPMNESWAISHVILNTYEYVMGYIWMSHEWYLKKTQFISQGVMGHA